MFAYKVFKKPYTGSYYVYLHKNIKIKKVDMYFRSGDKNKSYTSISEKNKLGKCINKQVRKYLNITFFILFISLKIRQVK